MAKSDQASVPSTALALIPEEQSRAIFATDPQRVQRLIERNLGGAVLGPNDLTRLQMPAAGSTAWEIPTTGKPAITQELDCVIVYTGGRRGWWEEIYGGTKRVPPTCSSLDMVHGSLPRQTNEDGREVFGTCDSCFYAQWGSKRNQAGTYDSGQDCKAVRAVYFLSEYGKLPMWIAFPPTSLVPWKKYLLQLAAAMLDYTEVLTRITLQRMQNDKGTFATPVLEVVGQLDEASKARSMAMSEWIGPLLRNVDLSTLGADDI